MRVCILGSPRSGTTTLFRYISESLRLEGFNEPYNRRMDKKFGERNITENDLWKKDNVVIKHLFEQLNKEQMFRLEHSFDKVLIIYRKNLTESIESWIHGYWTDNWDKPYKYKEKNYSFPGKERLKKNITNIRLAEIEIAKSLPYETFFYEDLYFKQECKDRLKDFLNITTDKFDYFLLSSNKLRKYKDDIKLTLL